MAVNFLDHTSIIMDSIVMFLLSILFIIMIALSHGDVFASSAVHHAIILLVITACAYGIPISKVRKEYSQRFAITASVFGALGITVSILSAIVYSVIIQSEGFPILTIIAEILVDFLAILMTVKYIRTSVILSKEQPMQVVHMQPSVTVTPVPGNVHGSMYPSQPQFQPAAQMIVVGPPVYQYQPS